MTQSHTLTLRVTLTDYLRLRAEADRLEMRITDLVRSYLSTGLRAEQQPPLETVIQSGRPRKGAA